MSLDENQRWARRTWMILVGAFAVVVGVNMVMAYLAIHTKPAVVSDRAYEEGLAYNETLNQGRKQAALGWRLVRISEEKKENLQYALYDARGFLLDGANVQGVAHHAVENITPYVFVFQRVSSGHYATNSVWSARGPWELILTVTLNDKTLKAFERIIVP